LEVGRFFEDEDVLRHVDDVLSPERRPAVGFQDRGRVGIVTNGLIDEGRLATATVDVHRDFARQRMALSGRVQQG